MGMRLPSPKKSFSREQKRRAWSASEETMHSRYRLIQTSWPRLPAPATRAVVISPARIVVGRAWVVRGARIGVRRARVVRRARIVGRARVVGRCTGVNDRARLIVRRTGHHR